MAIIIVSMVVCATIILSLSNYSYQPFFSTHNETLSVISKILGMSWYSVKIAFGIGPVLLLGNLILTSIDVFITRKKEFNNRYKNGFKEKGRR